MIAGRRSGTVLTLALLAAGLAGAWFVYQGLGTPISTGRPATVAREQPAGAEPAPVAQEFKLPPLKTFEATLQRPVFSRSRRPKAGAPVVVSQDLSVKVKGTTAVDAEKRALLVPQGGGETFHLRQGEEYQGWTLSEVGEGHVIFRRGEQKVRLEVDFKETPAPVRLRPRQPGVRQPAGGQGAQRNVRQNRQNQLQQQRQRQRQQNQQLQRQQNQQLQRQQTQPQGQQQRQLQLQLQLQQEQNLQTQ